MIWSVPVDRIGQSLVLSQITKKEDKIEADSQDKLGTLVGAFVGGGVIGTEQSNAKSPHTPLLKVPVFIN